MVSDCLIVFTGAVSIGGDQTNMVSYVIEPPQPVKTFVYRCDSTFFLEPVSGRCGHINIFLVPKISKFSMILLFIPSIAAMTAETDATPMMIPSVVKMLRVLLTHI